MLMLASARLQQGRVQRHGLTSTAHLSAITEQLHYQLRRRSPEYGGNLFHCLRALGAEHMTGHH